MKMQRLVVCTIAAIGALSSTTALHATTVDLIVNSSGTINGAIFSRDNFQTAGTGVINPIVRINGHGGQTASQGYNTSGRDVRYDEITDPNFTRNVQLREIPVVNVMGTDYLQFILDINEPRGNGAWALSLDMVNIYSNSIGGLTVDESMLGTLHYQMCPAIGSSVVLLDSRLNSGSGQGDMEMLIPLSNLAGALPTDFIYLFSAFGNHLVPGFQEQGGFEEWAIHASTALPPTVVIPIPGAASLGLFGMGMVLGVRRCRRDR